MKIDVDKNASLQDMQAALQQALAGRNAKFKLEKGALNVSLDNFHGAVIRETKTAGSRIIEVSPHMPLEGPLEIGSSLLAFLIYQSMGRLYGIIAIVIAIAWPILLGQLISKKFSVEVAGIIAKTIPTVIPAQEVEHGNEENVIQEPKPARKTCPKCGSLIRLANDLYCRKCGEKLR